MGATSGKKVGLGGSAGSRLRGALWERGFPPETRRAARLPSALPRRDPREGRKEERREGRKEGAAATAVCGAASRAPKLASRRGEAGPERGERGCAPGAGGGRGGNGSSWDRSRHGQLKGVSLNTAGRRGSLPALGERAGLGVLPR